MTTFVIGCLTSRTWGRRRGRWGGGGGGQIQDGDLITKCALVSPKIHLHCRLDLNGSFFSNHSMIICKQIKQIAF